jgi:hypothetical protein
MRCFGCFRFLPMDNEHQPFDLPSSFFLFEIETQIAMLVQFLLCLFQYVAFEVGIKGIFVFDFQQGFQLLQLETPLSNFLILFEEFVDSDTSKGFHFENILDVVECKSLFELQKVALQFIIELDVHIAFSSVVLTWSEKLD